MEDINSLRSVYLEYSRIVIETISNIYVYVDFNVSQRNSFQLSARHFQIVR